MLLSLAAPQGLCSLAEELERLGIRAVRLRHPLDDSAKRLAVVKDSDRPSGSFCDLSTTTAVDYSIVTHLFAPIGDRLWAQPAPRDEHRVDFV